MFLYKKAKGYNNSLQLIVYRMIRLYPAYWCGVCLSFCIRRFLIKDEITIVDFIFNLTMIENLFGIAAIDGVYWTMAYEIMLLFILACIVFVGNLLIIKRKIDKSLICNSDLICTIWICLGYISQIIMKLTGLSSSSIKLILFGSSYIFVFVIGIIFCDIYMYGIKIGKWKIINILIALLYEVSFMPFATACIAIFASILVWVALSGKLLFFNFSILLSIGKVSYPLYLCHRYWGEYFIPFASGENIYFKGLVFMIVSFSFAFVSAIIVGKLEKRIIKYIKSLKVYQKIM